MALLPSYVGTLTCHHKDPVMNQPAKWNVTCSGDVKANSFYLTPKTKKKKQAHLPRVQWNLLEAQNENHPPRSPGQERWCFNTILFLSKKRLYRYGLVTVPLVSRHYKPLRS